MALQITAGKGRPAGWAMLCILVKCISTLVITSSEIGIVLGLLAWQVAALMPQAITSDGVADCLGFVRAWREQQLRTPAWCVWLRPICLVAIFALPPNADRSVYLGRYKLLIMRIFRIAPTVYGSIK